MATELASAYVQIIPSAQGMRQQLTEILGDEMPSGEESGKSWGSGLVSGIKSMIAAAGIGAALKASISEGAALEQSLGGVETLFKDSAGTVIQYAEQAYRTAGMSANAYMETVTGFSASLLQGLGGDTQKAAQVADMAMTDMSDNANKMGTDMGLIQNAYQGFAKQNYTMLDNLKLGYGGTKAEMERLLADAQEISGVEYNINNLSDVYEAIHVIQGELGITGTTAKEAASTISGSFASMKAAAQNVLGKLSLGEDLKPSLDALKETAVTFVAGNLLPALGNVLKGVPTIVGEAFTSLTSALPEVAAAASGLMGTLANGLRSALPTLIPAALSAVGSFASNLRSGAGQLVDSALNLIMTLAQGLIDNIPVFISTVPAIVTDLAGIINDNAPKLLEAGLNLTVQLGKGLITAIPTLIANIPQIIQAVVSVWQAFNWLDLGKHLVTSVKDGVTHLKDDIPKALKNVGQSALNFFKGIDWGGLGRAVIGFIKSGIQGLFTAIPNALKSIGSSGLSAFKSISWSNLGSAVISLIKSGLQGLGSSIVTALRTIGSNALNAFKSISWGNVGRTVINLIKSAISGAASGVVNALRNVGSSAMSAFKSISWSSLGSNIISGITNGIKNGASAIKNAAKSAASAALSAAKSLLGIHSPSRVFRDEVGKNISLGMAEGILGNAGAVSSALDTVNQVPSPAAVKADWIYSARYAAGNGTAGDASSDPAGQLRPITVQVVLDGKVVGQTSVEYINRQVRTNGKSPLLI